MPYTYGARPLRFALSVNRVLASRQDWSEVARRAEDWGYDALVLGDHVGAERYAAIPALAYAAAHTEKLRLGSFMFNNDFRHPSVLAKEAATLDIMTGGRFDLGIGAGWMKGDYEMTGIPKDSGPVRAERLEESLIVLKGLFAPGPFSFPGRHYQIRKLEGLPKPIQKPHPPLVVGGGGEVVLKVAARHADVVGLNPVHRKGVPGAGPELSRSAVEERVEWVRAEAGRHGRDPELHVLLHGMAVGPGHSSRAADLAREHRMTLDQALASPYLVVGDEGRAEDRLVRLNQELGISYFSVRVGDAEQFAPVLKRIRKS